MLNTYVYLTDTSVFLSRRTICLLKCQAVALKNFSPITQNQRSEQNYKPYAADCTPALNKTYVMLRTQQFQGEFC